MPRLDDDRLMREAAAAACRDVADQTLTSPELDAHIQSCEHCKALIAEMQAEAWEEALGLHGHLPARVLAGWAEDRAGLRGFERELAEQHVAGCTLCRQTIRMLENVQPETVPDASTSGVSDLWGRVRAWWASGEGSLASPPRVAFAVLLIVATATAIFLRGGWSRDRALDSPILENALAYYETASSSDILRHSASVASARGVAVDRRAQVLTVRAAVSLALGDTTTARHAIREILRQDPESEMPYVEAMPPVLVGLFDRERARVLGARVHELAARPRSETAITTVAIGDIENNPLVPTSIDMDNFCRGLAYAIMSDISAAGSPLRVVDRHRLGALRRELDLREGGPSDAKRNAGLLLGAESFIFGSVMVYDTAHVRMDFRFVNTRTTEIVVSKGDTARFRSPAELFEVERRIIMRLLAEVEERLQGVKGTGFQLDATALERGLSERRSHAGTDIAYARLLETAGAAFAAEDAGDYAAAIAGWTRVSEADPTSPIARARRAALEAYERHRPI